MMAIIGGETARFAPFAGLFHRALAEFGQPERPVGVHSPGHIAATDEQAIEEFWPHYETAFAEAARVRGFRPPTKQNFLRDAGPGGALHVGSPETIARKITETLKTLGASRFDLKYGMPGVSQTSRARSHASPGTGSTTCTDNGTLRTEYCNSRHDGSPC
jgi:alkanesulfonate monooxygenase SsuD/methylene tetrahydromethanopterin reductase-like flavin-dependent oxidoreductase (luciferase family)